MVENAVNGALPAAYHPDVVTQQWSINIDESKTMRNMRVKDQFLRHIEAGRKDLEVRVAYPAIKTIKLNELIDFTSRTRNVLARVIDIRNYPSFEGMLKVESPDRIVPGESNQSLLRILREIYPPAKERLGVIVIQISPVKSE